MMSSYLDRPTVKQLGVTAFVFLVGLAIGNGYRTTEALQGSARWWEQQVKAHEHLQSANDWKACGQLLGE